ncbi:TPA: hypothetical protein ACHKJ6_004383, partial [Escherichia coli]
TSWMRFYAGTSSDNLNAIQQERQFKIDISWRKISLLRIAIGYNALSVQNIPISKLTPFNCK